VEGEDRGDGDLGWRASSSSERIVSGGRRPSLRIVAALVAACLAVGVVLARDGGDAGEPTVNGDGDGDGEEPTGAEMEVTDAADVSAAYAVAVRRLGRAGTFAFQGTVRSEGANLVRPGPHVADEVTVEGAVHVPLSISTEVAVGPDGSVAETVTSGPAAWARRASDRAGLAEARWTVVREDAVPVLRREPVEPLPSRLGVALVVDAVQAAGDRREAPEDEEGRQVFRATVPVDRTAQAAQPQDIADVAGGAELVVALDDAGDIAHVELTNPPGRPTLEVALDLRRLGHSDVIHPADLAEPIGGTIPPGVLGEVGLGSLAVPGLPTTWALTGATVYRPDGSLGPVPAGCEGPVLSLMYNDLTTIAEGELGLTVRRHGCGQAPGVAVGTGARGEVEVTAGRFSGTADPSGGGLGYGEVTDGTTVVLFATDLPYEATAAAIASLMPATAEPPG
jgi:hypothetical protein